MIHNFYGQHFLALFVLQLGLLLNSGLLQDKRGQIFWEETGPVSSLQGKGPFLIYSSNKSKDWQL